MNAVSRRLPVLFLIALVGILTAIGVVLGQVAGGIVAASYAVVVAVGLFVAGWMLRPEAPPASHGHAGCDCCGDEPWKGVEVR